MTVVVAQGSIRQYRSAVTLPEYAHIIGYRECAFFGVDHPDNEQYQCREIWTKAQRDMIAYYLSEAQVEIENLTNYPLSPVWVTGQLDDQHEHDARFLDEQPATNHPSLAWGMILEAGIRAESVIEANAAVDLTNDPSVIGPIATTVTDIDEIFVYYPGTDIEIYPSKIALSGGNVTIEIPRCRMVDYDKLDNPTSGWAYDDDANFQATVDVKRVYNDPSVNAVLLSNHSCSLTCSASGCANFTQPACMRIKDAKQALVDVFPGSYDNGWSRASTRRCFDYMQLNYRAGFKRLDNQFRDTIVRLAHSKMPIEPCGCDPVRFIWQRDRNIPPVITRERAACPFGLNDGAWIAYSFAADRARGYMDII